MIAKSDEYIQEAVDTVYQLSREEQIRLQCEAREDYNRRMRRMEKLLEENKKISAEKEKADAEIIRLQQLLLEHGIADK